MKGTRTKQNNVKGAGRSKGTSALEKREATCPRGTEDSDRTYEIKEQPLLAEKD